MVNSLFSELISSGIEDFEDKLFDFICDSKKRVSIDKFKAVSETVVFLSRTSTGFYMTQILLY